MSQNIKSRVGSYLAGGVFALATVFAAVQGGRFVQTETPVEPELVPADVAACQISRDSSGAYRASVRKQAEDGERRGKLMYRFQNSSAILSDENQGVAEIPRGVGSGAHFEPVGEFIIRADEKACDVLLDGKAPKRFFTLS